MEGRHTDIPRSYGKDPSVDPFIVLVLIKVVF